MLISPLQNEYFRTQNLDETKFKSKTMLVAHLDKSTFSSDCGNPDNTIMLRLLNLTLPWLGPNCRLTQSQRFSQQTLFTQNIR